jgi:hypothetical protein
MIKYVVVIILLGQAVNGQQPKPFLRVKTEENRKDWSVLDRLYLATKIIFPGSIFSASPDTLHFELGRPAAAKDSITLDYIQQKFYDALSVCCFTKDSMPQKAVALFMCTDTLDRDSTNCKGWIYELKNHKYRTYPMEQKLRTLLSVLYWRTGLYYYSHGKRRKSILLFHQIDTSQSFSTPLYLESFCQDVALLIGDMVSKAKRNTSRKYVSVLNIFYSGQKLLYYSRSMLNKDAFKSAYSYKFYESSVAPAPDRVGATPDFTK